jgi:anti-sigma factor RsiW
MSRHLTDSLLDRFVAGSLESPVAQEVALHIDACASCSNRAIGLDPLGTTFATIDDPPIPEALAARLRAAVDATPTMRPEWIAGFGVALLAAAALLLVVLGEPATLVSSAGTALFASATGATALSGTLFDHPLALAGIGALLCVTTLGVVVWLGLAKDD